MISLVYIHCGLIQMIEKHISQAKRQQRKGVYFERKKLFALAISFYQIARNRWRQTPGSRERVNWCNGRISQCHAMMTVECDDNE